jgi:diguanylate cyclase (GGDEF)-like protein
MSERTPQSVFPPPDAASCFDGSEGDGQIMAHARLLMMAMMQARDDSDQFIAQNGCSLPLSTMKDPAMEVNGPRVIARDVCHTTSIGAWEYDVLSETILWSEAMFQLLDFDPVLGTPTLKELLERYNPTEIPMHAIVVHEPAATTQAFEFPVRVATVDGSTRWVHVWCEVAQNEQGQYSRLSGTVRDITEQRQAEEQLQAANERLVRANAQLEIQKRQLEEANALLTALATTDGLTGLKNHRTFHERLKTEVDHAARYHSPLSVLILDVDDFKSYNDTYGHPAGDQVLQKIAEVLQAISRQCDLAARYGGEEFAIILPETDGESAKIVAERFRSTIEVLPWHGRSVTVSIGIASRTATTCDAAQLVKQADEALYRSKYRGRNRVTHVHDFIDFTESSPAQRG